MKEYKRCNRCVMDNISDDKISFDKNGICNYCSDALIKMGDVYFPNDIGKNRLDELINKLKKENKKRKYDCIMGISGGLDSSYLAYLGAVKWGLRILAIHVDDGYDTEISKNNIRKLVEGTNIDFYNIKPDAKQFNELTRAYILAGVPNLAVPQDNVLFATIYKFIKKHKINTFLSGGNFALEGILQKGNTFDCYDVRNIKDINKKHGRDNLSKINLVSNFQRDINLIFYKLNFERPLNYINYNRDSALKELKEFCDFEYYGSKHLENTLTKFIQTYWFYNKFKVDKRKSHFSSMIISNQLSRENAINLLKKPVYDKKIIKKDINDILENIDLSSEEFSNAMNAQSRQHNEFKTSRYNKARNILKKFITPFVKHT